MKNTIAIVAVKSKSGMAIAKRLALGNNLLLLIRGEDDHAAAVFRDIRRSSPASEIELIDCAREGCWEADMIILDTPSSSEKMIVERIREVATQKIVLRISDSQENRYAPFKTAQELQRLMPFSKVVAAFCNPTASEAFIAGDNEEAVQIISNMMRIAGYRPVIAESLSAIKTF